MKRDFRYELIPQMKTYDNLGFEWLPYLMFSQTPNFRSDVLNTDENGYRYSDKKEISYKNIFDVRKEDAQDEGVNLILGNSFGFGVGATEDLGTISGNLNDKNVFFNIACRAHVGFQEILSVFSNIHKFKKVNKIIVISGIADFYLSKYFKMTYPDLLYFNSDFLSSMNKSRINTKKRITKKFLDIFFPNILNEDNLWKLNKNNLKEFITSREFRDTFKSKKEEFTTVSLEEKLNRNFSIYKLFKSYFNCEVEFYLNPILNWCKEFSEEEQKLYDYTNEYYSSLSKFVFKILTKENHNYLSGVIKQISNKHEIPFYDANLYFKDVASKKDWLFVDAAHCNDEGYKIMSDYIRLSK